MKNKPIDHFLLLNKIEKQLKGLPFTYHNHQDGRQLILTTVSPKAKLEIEITSKWVGFEFSVENIGMIYFENTDLYPLNHDPKFTTEIFNSLEVFLDELINKKIFIGEYKGSPAVARPNKGNYEVRAYPPKKWWKILDNTKYFYVTEHEIKTLSSMHPILVK